MQCNIFLWWIKGNFCSVNLMQHIPKSSSCVTTFHWNTNCHARTSYLNADNYSKPTPTMYCQSHPIPDMSTLTLRHCAPSGMCTSGKSPRPYWLYCNTHPWFVSYLQTQRQRTQATEWVCYNCPVLYVYSVLADQRSRQPVSSLRRIILLLALMVQLM